MAIAQPIFRAHDHVFVDESKARGYYVVATATSPSSVALAGKALRGLLKPGQRRLHFKSENDRRRRQLLSRMCELDVRVSVWLVQQLSDKEARPRCMGALVDEAIRAGTDQLIIERDASLERIDRQLIATALRRQYAQRPRYSHAAPHEHPLLWVSDAVAWCYSKGGDWTRRVDTIVHARVTHI